jgi:hypothetical protein
MHLKKRCLLALTVQQDILHPLVQIDASHAQLAMNAQLVLQLFAKWELIVILETLLVHLVKQDLFAIKDQELQLQKNMNAQKDTTVLLLIQMELRQYINTLALQEHMDLDQEHLIQLQLKHVNHAQMDISVNLEQMITPDTFVLKVTIALEALIFL